MRISLLSTACRLPGADTPHGFWKTLVDGKTLRSPVPADRFDIGAFSSDFWPTEIRPPCWGTFIEDPWKFDASRFHFHEEEADWTDPQQRLLLTCTHEAFDAAGIEPGECRTGVFIGGSYVSYNDRMRQQIMAGRKVPDTTIVGGLANMLSARISQVFAFNGPSLTVDTACSSVLVALHLARRSIEAGECNIAVVGGAHLIVSATAHLLMGRAGALSPEGHCLPFGAAADGTLLGEGVGVFLVASTDLAASRKWPELARIVATAVDSDGPTLKPMAPRPGGQVEVMRRAWEEAGLDPETASLIEAHGAGTPVGDRVEASSLAELFSASPRNRHLGSVKGNVGHLMSAAGVPSLLKVVLAMQHRVVPATLFGSAPSPKLKLQNSGLSIHDRSVAWDGERVWIGVQKGPR